MGAHKKKRSGEGDKRTNSLICLYLGKLKKGHIVLFELSISQTNSYRQDHTHLIAIPIRLTQYVIFLYNYIFKQVTKLSLNRFYSVSCGVCVKWKKTAHALVSLALSSFPHPFLSQLCTLLLLPIHPYSS